MEIQKRADGYILKSGELCVFGESLLDCLINLLEVRPEEHVPKHISLDNHEPMS